MPQTLPLRIDAKLRLMDGEVPNIELNWPSAEPITCQPDKKKRSRVEKKGGVPYVAVVEAENVTTSCGGGGGGSGGMGPRVTPNTREPSPTACVLDTAVRSQQLSPWLACPEVAYTHD